jgi:hypothetical protein
VGAQRLSASKEYSLDLIDLGEGRVVVLNACRRQRNTHGSLCKPLSCIDLGRHDSSIKISTPGRMGLLDAAAAISEHKLLELTA